MYQKLPLGTHQPGLIFFLVDQSESMSHPYGTGTKQEFVAIAVNRCICEIMSACRAGETFRDRCHIAVVGYGQLTGVIMGGRPSELSQQIRRSQIFKRTVPDGAGGLAEYEQKLPIWIEPRAENGSPMDKALDLVTELVQAWVTENPLNFPPIVINISGGEPNDPARAAMSATRLLGLGTTDGSVLLLNAYIADDAAYEIKLPSDEKGLPTASARLLFEMSSVLPEPMIFAARNAGFAPIRGARGFIMNASPDSLTKLIVFGSTVAR
jgi:subtilisin family serine protease